MKERFEICAIIFIDGVHDMMLNASLFNYFSPSKQLVTFSQRSE